MNSRCETCIMSRVGKSDCLPTFKSRLKTRNQRTAYFGRQPEDSVTDRRSWRWQLDMPDTMDMTDMTWQALLAQPWVPMPQLPQLPQLLSFSHFVSVPGPLTADLGHYGQGYESFCLSSLCPSLPWDPCIRTRQVGWCSLLCQGQTSKQLKVNEAKWFRWHHLWYGENAQFDCRYICKHILHCLVILHWYHLHHFVFLIGLAYWCDFAIFTCDFIVHVVHVVHVLSFPRPQVWLW